jgi:dUTP pyrophosphatase
MTKTISINFKRFDKSIPLPVFKTKGAVAADMYSRLDVDIAPNEIAYIPLNVAIEIPEGYCIFLISRSSTHKFGIRSVNGIGIFDNDFCGDDDEYKFIVQNFTDKPVHIEKGSRVAQILLVKKENFIINELDNFKHNPTRGGIGSTGQK